MESVRVIERSLGNPGASRFSASAFDLDLSAFDERPHLAGAQDRRQPGAASIMQPRKVTAGSSALSRRDGPSKRSAQRQAERAAERRAAPAANVARRPNQVVSARIDHLHAERSPSARKERSRETCKERPEPNKKGRGASRAFVPWCSRRG